MTCPRPATPARPAPDTPCSTARSPRHQIQAAGAIALVLEAPVAEFAQPVEEHGPGQRVPASPLFRPDMDPSAQLDALQPFQGEQRAFDPAQFPQRQRQTVLAGIAAELAQHERGRHGALLDRRRQAQDFVPVGADLLDVDGRRSAAPAPGSGLVSPGT